MLGLKLDHVSKWGAWWQLLGLLSWYPTVKSLQLVGNARSSSEFQYLNWMIGYQDTSPSNARQSDMFYCFIQIKACRQIGSKPLSNRNQRNPSEIHVQLKIRLRIRFLTLVHFWNFAHSTTVITMKITYLDRVTHIWVIDAYTCHWTWSSLLQVMACRLYGAKTLPEPLMNYCKLTLENQLQANFHQIRIFSLK